MWANTFREGEGIARHCHRNLMTTSTNWTCTNLFIGGDPGVGTWFEERSIESGRTMMFFFHHGFLQQKFEIRIHGNGYPFFCSWWT